MLAGKRYARLELILQSTIIVVAFLGIPASTFSAMASKTSTSMTISKYEAYLRKYSTTTAKHGGVSPKYRSSAVAGAKKTVVSFFKIKYCSKDEIR